MSSPTRRCGKRSDKVANSFIAKKVRDQKKSQAPTVVFQETPTLSIVLRDETEEDDEEAQRQNLLRISTTMMNDIFCGELRPSSTSFLLKPGGCESKAMDYFLNAFAPAQKTLRISINASLRSKDPLVSAVFPLALHHEELFHAVVALSLCSMESSSFYESDGHILNRPSTDIFYHRQWALSYLREKLTPPCCYADNAALLTTTALLLLDGILGDTASLRAHCLGLRQMVQARGGINSPDIDKLLRHFILQCDYCWSLEAGLPVAFTLPKLTVENPFEAVPAGFQEIDFSGLHMPYISHIVSRMHSWTESVARICNGTETYECKGLIHSYAPFHDTIEAMEILEELQSTNPDGIAAALCLALILISQNFYGKGRFYKWYQKFRIQLTEILLQKDLRKMASAERNCFAWIWMIAAESWRISSTLLEPGHQLMHRLLYQFEEAEDWEELRSVLTSFLWYDALGEKWRACWEECIISRGFDGSCASMSPSVSPPTRYSAPSRCPTVANLT